MGVDLPNSIVSVWSRARRWHRSVRAREAPGWSDSRRASWPDCGLGLTGRYLCGGLIGLCGLVLVTGLSSCHATTALVLMLIVLAGMAMRGGAERIAAANMVAAATLVAVVMVS
jgi:hypothetical protein